MVLLYMVLAGLTTAMLSAMTITLERDARSWPILLTTPLDDWQIIAAKGLGAVRRGLPVWGLLAVHVACFVVAGIIHPMAVVPLTLAVLGLIALLTGSGLYFSSRFAHTTSAVIANLLLPAGVLWVLVPVLIGALTRFRSVPREDIEFWMVLTGAVPVVALTGISLRVIWRRLATVSALLASLVLGSVLLLLGPTAMRLMMEVSYGQHSIVDLYMAACPFDQAAVITRVTVQGWDDRSSWPQMDPQSDRFTGFVLATTTLYVLIGLFFAWLAKARLRRGVF
jgi:hypothetical protein